jgi:hypothetical protein
MHWGRGIKFASTINSIRLRALNSARFLSPTLSCRIFAIGSTFDIPLVVGHDCPFLTSLALEELAEVDCGNKGLQSTTESWMLVELFDRDARGHNSTYDDQRTGFMILCASFRGQRTMGRL